jgi:hypothetical protein
LGWIPFEQQVAYALLRRQPCFQHLLNFKICLTVLRPLVVLLVAVAAVVAAVAAVVSLAAPSLVPSLPELPVQLPSSDSRARTYCIPLLPLRVR